MAITRTYVNGSECFDLSLSTTSELIDKFEENYNESYKLLKIDPDFYDFDYSLDWQIGKFKEHTKYFED